MKPSLLTKLIPVSCAATFLAFASAGSAAILVTYQFNTANPSGPTSPSPLVSASDVDDTSQFQISPTSGSTFLRHNSGSSNLAQNNGPQSLEDAISRGTYIEFTITPTSAGLDLASFRFTHTTSRITANDVTPGNFTSSLAVFASTSGFATAPAPTDVLDISTGTTTSTSTSFGTKDVSLTSFSGLTPSDTLTFRVYAYGDGTAYNQVTRIDN
ncbi:MAG: hypothetical protein EOP88_26800, partial [Verrucomicrobiaceae bacterium]